MKDKINKIIKQMSDYKEQTNCKGVVLGVSGGKDSYTVAMLAKLVFGDNVIGVYMPHKKYTYEEEGKIRNFCDCINIKYLCVPIIDSYNTTIDLINDNSESEFLNEKTKTNIPPRLRMLTIYAIAQNSGFRVIGTGNKSESYLGWTTKYGDSACDFNPIGDYTCTEVVQIGRKLCNIFNIKEDIILLPPSDGLCGKSDEESFGFTYKELDNYILYGKKSDNFEKISLMNKITKHKREMPLTFEK